MAPNETRRSARSEVISIQLIIETHRGDIAVDLFKRSRFGAFLQRHFNDLFTKPCQELFLMLALGFVLSPTRHTVANYLWRSGACAYRHFTRFYGDVTSPIFLGGPFYEHLDWLFVSVIKLAQRYVPDEEDLRVRFDDTTAKKTGKAIEPASRYRNGAGTARQEIGYLMRYPRTLYGKNFVVGQMLIRLRAWPGEFISVPIGLAVYIKEDKAHRLGLPYRSRSELAREMLERLDGVVSPERRLLSVQDGAYATVEFLKDLPARVEVLGRLPRNSPLYGAAALPGVVPEQGGSKPV